MPKKKKPKSPCSGGRPKERKSLDGVKSRNFWNTCPLKLDALPEEECELGQQSARARSDAKVPCEWSINSKEHNYCFWKWLRANSHKDGTMRPMMQSEIADQMGCSSTKVHFILKDGIKKLKKRLLLPPPGGTLPHRFRRGFR